MTDKRKRTVMKLDVQPVDDTMMLVQAAREAKAALDKAQQAYETAELAVAAASEIHTVEDLIDKYGKDGKLDTAFNWRYNSNPEDQARGKLINAMLQRFGWATDGGGEELLKTPPSLLLKWVRIDGTPIAMAQGQEKWSMPTQNKDGTWTPGAWRTVEGPVATCNNGLHCTDIDGLDYWGSNYGYSKDAVVAIVEVEGPVFHAYNKYVARKMRLLSVITLEKSIHATARKLFLEDHEEEVRQHYAPLGLNKKDAKAALELDAVAWSTYSLTRINVLKAEDFQLQAKALLDPSHKKDYLAQRKDLKAYRERLNFSTVDVFHIYGRAKGIDAGKLRAEYTLKALGL